MFGKKQRVRKLHKRRSAIIAFCLALSLIATSVMMAQHPTARPTSRSINDPVESKPASPSSLLPSAPLKEYIYVGGKLVATEEPTQ